MIILRPPPPDPAIRFRIRLDATPALIGKLLALEEGDRQVENARLRAAGMAIIRRYLPPDLIGTTGQAHTVSRTPSQVMRLYQVAVERSAQELSELGLVLNVTKGLWR